MVGTVIVGIVIMICKKGFIMKYLFMGAVLFFVGAYCSVLLAFEAYLGLFEPILSKQPVYEQVKLSGDLQESSVQLQPAVAVDNYTKNDLLIMTY